MTDSATLNLPPITPYQQRAIFGHERSAVIEATTKAGKTYGCILWLLHMAGVLGLDKPAREFWWVAPIYEQADIAFRRCRTMLIQADPTLTIWKPNESKLSITLANGATLRFKSADKPDGLYGEDVYAAVIDEASRCKEEAWHAVRSTLTATGGRVRIIGNVKGRKNWAYHIARRAESGTLGEWGYAKITAHDAVGAGILTTDDVAMAKAELPDAVFRELYLAEPSEDGSNPFGLEHIARCVGTMGHGKPVAYGVDLAKSVDWTVVIGLDADGRVCAFDRWQHTPWDQTTERVMAMIGDTPALIDSTGVGDPIFEAIHRRSPMAQGFKFTSTSKQQIMEGLAVAIQSGRVQYPDGPIRTELDSFEYEVTRTGARYTAPDGVHDDCVCALALAINRAASFRPVTVSFVSHSDTAPVLTPQQMLENKPIDIEAETNRMLAGMFGGLN